MRRRHLLQLLASTLLGASPALAQQGPLLGVWKAAVAAGVAPAWNPADKTTQVDLSNSNHTATLNASAGYKGVRGVNFVSTGKKYFEAVVGFAGGGGNAFVGAASAACDITQALGNTTDGIGYGGTTGNVQLGGIVLATQATYTTGDVVQVAIDYGSLTVWFGKNGTFVGNPAAGTGGYACSAVAVGVYACTTMLVLATFATLQPPAYPIPSGFTALT